MKLSERFERVKGSTEIDEMLLRLTDGRRVSIISAYNRPTGRVRFKIIERKGKTPCPNRLSRIASRSMLKFIAMGDHRCPVSHRA